ncbi:BTAD domain-containing putative transcriptional regulator [Modestobacter sp. NPDC049651]|uniref:BTAD domain-containing putative transcriptional regulator n=1 Tax=unclassified Modestobacter TaxID=2643866 RepID=UPI0033F38EC9
MEYRLLGPLEVLRDGAPVDLGAPKQRAVLAVLLLDRGRVVSTDRLVDAVWGAAVPPSVRAGLQAYVSNLRRVLRSPAGAGSPLRRQAPGYVLDVPAAAVDLVAFTDGAEQARAAGERGDWSAAAGAAATALDRWRGPLLADLADEPWVQVERVRLDEQRAECRETLAAALLATGRTGAALAELTALRAEHPLRERAAELQVLALHRAGRSAEALEVWARHARTLADELGLEPGPRLRDLQAAVLRQDPALLHRPGPPPPSAPAPAEPPAPAPAPAPPTTLVGRARELGELDRVLADVTAGRTRWLLLCGPAGIGKSRLAQEAAARVVAAGGREVWVRCPDDEGTPAWWPLRPAVRALGADPDEVLVPPAGVDADAARFAVYDRVHRLVAAAADPGRPLALVVDDAQWADRTTLRCLASLAGTLRDVPVLVVLTVRDGEAGPAVADLVAATARADGTCQLAVPPLAAAEVSVLADQVAAERLRPSEAFLLAERTGGNPLFVCEYARLPPSERLGEGIPFAVRTVLGRRLTGLDPAVRQVLRAAAVAGDVLDVELLTAVTGLDADTLADRLDDAADERLVVCTPDGGAYAFAHGLLREAVLAELPPPRRQRLHARVAAALAGAGGDRLAERAGHLLAALPLADPVEVVAVCRAAARDAEERWSSESAAHWWGAALRTAELLPRGATWAEERDDLLIARVTALARAGRGQTVQEVVAEGLLDAVRAGRTATAGRLVAVLLRSAGSWPWAAYGEDPGPLRDRLAAVEPLVAGDPAAHVRVLAALAVGSYYEPDPALRETLSARALHRAEALGDPDVLADALLGRVLSQSGLAGRAAESVRLLDRLLALPHAQSRVDDVLAHDAMTLALLSLGELDRIGGHARLAVAGSDLLRLPVYRAQLRWLATTLSQWRGDFAEAERAHDLAAELHRATELYGMGDPDPALIALRWDQGRLAELPPLDTGSWEPVPWGAAAVAAALGDRTAAAELVTARLQVPSAAPWTALSHLVLLAHVVADLGLRHLADELLTRLTPDAGLVANVGQVGVVGPVDLALGRLHALCGDRESARGALDAAAALARRTGGRPSLLRCRAVAAELDPDPARRRARLAEVAADADRLGMTGVAARARTAPGR